MDWFKKHADSVAVIVAVVGAAMWMQSSLFKLRIDVERELALVKGEISTVKTVLIVQGHMTKELAKQLDD